VDRLYLSTTTMVDFSVEVVTSLQKVVVVAFQEVAITVF
jgi:hypothetical protein